MFRALDSVLGSPSPRSEPTVVLFCTTSMRLRVKSMSSSRSAPVSPPRSPAYAPMRTHSASWSFSVLATSWSTSASVSGLIFFCFAFGRLRLACSAGSLVMVPSRQQPGIFLRNRSCYCGRSSARCRTDGCRLDRPRGAASSQEASPHLAECLHVDVARRRPQRRAVDQQLPVLANCRRGPTCSPGELRHRDELKPSTGERWAPANISASASVSKKRRRTSFRRRDRAPGTGSRASLPT